MFSGLITKANLFYQFVIPVVLDIRIYASLGNLTVTNQFGEIIFSYSSISSKDMGNVL